MGLVLFSSSSSTYFSLIVFFLFVFVSFVFVLILTNIFNFGFVVLALFLFFFHFVIFGFIIRHFLVTLLLDQKFDGITNELGMLFHNLFDLFLLFILDLVFFQVKNNFGASTNRFAISICFDGEGSASRGLPNVLFIVV